MAKDRLNFRLSATPITVFAHLFGIAATTLVLVWTLHFQDGLALKSDIKQKIFNLHPVLMIIGFVVIGGEGIMVYKLVPSMKKKNQKLVHLIMLLITLFVGILGVYAVFKFHREAGFRHMVTFHSWLGIVTISLFGLQWFLGFFYFILPATEKQIRARVIPWHIFLGMVIFLMAICTAETGLVQEFIFLGLVPGQEAFVVNFLGLMILLFGITVSLTVILPKS